MKTETYAEMMLRISQELRAAGWSPEDAFVLARIRTAAAFAAKP